ncbi:apolipoprotein N-acyltransferase [Isoptericola sp. NEAU-Y5]|uniref:Apolipoprotein N-acyltransferase n=1 Tax=Isoptericola luteus TaxID=2879484 RepID=A0ABS7ZM52_9MICO|nr:apolipoprotein N-acyltransferase [Isoptericola sp. NEAU-Y5]MCA5894744.1 apolipoprotein N-acyltransferase [Isoptericola sp. NEAU-Y5]
MSHPSSPATEPDAPAPAPPLTPAPPTDRWASRPATLGLAVASGVALWASFPDVGAWPLAFVAVGLLHAALRRDGRRAAGWNTLVGLVAGVTFWLPHIWWANFATDTVPWIALALLEAAFFAGFGALWTWARRWRQVRRNAATQAVVFAVVFVAVEQWRSEIPFGGFPWGRLAWTVAGAPTGRAAWLGGTTAVSLLIAAAGVLLALAAGRVLARRAASAAPTAEGDTEGDTEGTARGTGTRTAGGRRLSGGLVMVAAAAALALGPLALPLPSDAGTREVTDAADPGHAGTVVDAGTGTAEVGVLRAGAVQGNVSEPGEGSFANRAEVLNNHLQGTYTIAGEQEAGAFEGVGDGGGVDVVLWPENGSDLDPQTTPDVAAAIDEAARTVDAPILVGAQEYPDTGGRYNVALLWEPGFGVTQRYAKQHPAPFGEYIPIRGFVRMFSAQVDRVTNDMIAGTEPAVIDLPVDGADVGRTPGPTTVPLATVICFEIAYDEIVRDAVQRGAQVLVVPTNNASFGYTAESTQQLAMTRMQAITTGRAAVQVSTVGVSGVVAPDGTLVARTQLFTADHLVADLPLRTTLTPAVRAGYWPGWVVGAAATVLVLGGAASALAARRRGRPAA